MGVHCLEIVQGLNVGENMSKCASLKKKTRLVRSTTAVGLLKMPCAADARLYLGGETAKALWAKLVFRMGGSIWNGDCTCWQGVLGVNLLCKREEQIRQFYVYDFEKGTLQGGCKSWDNFSHTHTWAQRCSCLLIMNT